MLSKGDIAVLDFERSWWLNGGPKDQQIEFTLGLSAAGYYEHLLSLVARRDADDYDPLTIRRIRTVLASADSFSESVG